MLIGNVGKDPEVRYVENGVCTARVSLAPKRLATLSPMAHKCLTALNGITSCFGEKLQK